MLSLKVDGASRIMAARVDDADELVRKDGPAFVTGSCPLELWINQGIGLG